MHEVGERIDGEALLARITAADLAGAISRREGSVPKKVGQRLRVRCPSPSHPDTRPSCDVSEKNGRAVWHCWSCGASGNAVTWWRIVNGNAPYPTVLAGLVDEFMIRGAAPPSSSSMVTDSRPSGDDKEAPDFAGKMSKLRERAASDLLKKFARQKCLPDEVLRANDIHSARRWHRCEPGSCPTATVEGTEPQWVGITVVRVPLVAADGVIAGWQDIITRTDAERHFYGQKKRTATNCQFPIAGLADVPADPSRVMLLEGVTDWLTARAAAPNWSSVGALGSERMSESAALLAETVRDATRVTLVVIGDGDRAGDKGAAEAVKAWPGNTVRLRPRDGHDLSDIWCASQQSEDLVEGWWQDALDATFEAARSGEGDGATWAVPVPKALEPRPAGAGTGCHPRCAVDQLPTWPPEDAPEGERIVAVLRSIEGELAAFDTSSSRAVGRIPKGGHVWRRITRRGPLLIRPDGPSMKLTAVCARPPWASHRGSADGCDIRECFELVENRG